MDLYNEFLVIPTQPTEAVSSEDFKLQLEIEGVMTGVPEYMTYS
jgi:hypothetical protein